MKKLFFLFITCLCILSCSGISGTVNPLAPKTVVVENTASFPISIRVYTVFNSELSFSGIINSGDKKVFSNVSECDISPSAAYNWKAERSYDKNGNQAFKLRALTDGEKLKVTVWNTNITAGVKLKYKVKASGTAFETTPLIPNGLGELIKLYDTDYEFELDTPPSLPSSQKINISYDKAAKRINITQVPTE